MKKTIMLTALAAVVCFLGACKKEGVYNPSEKISKIYKSSTYVSQYYDGSTWRDANNESSPKRLTEAWNWDGKKLMSIDSYNSDGTVEADETVKFEYDGKRLTKITDVTGKNYATITYDGKVIDKVEMFNDGVSSGTITFTYDGKKVSKIVYNFVSVPEEDKAPRSAQLLNFVNQLLTPSNNEDLTAMIRKDMSKGTESATMTYTWDGKNISQETYTAGSYSVTNTYTYDNMNNPYKGNIMGYFDNETVLAASKNNVTKIVTTYTDEGRSISQTTDITYKYDGKWPTECTSSDSETYDEFRTTRTRTTYYEYL